MSDFLFGPKAQPAQVQQAATVDQANQSFGNTQQGLAQQQAFVQALQAQNGIQNQSDVYNQLAQQAAGQGPNPAQQALSNATGANVANQAALMAGQRGASANPALIARQAAMQGANIQQQAAGQGALMQAQQQNEAVNQMANIAGQQVANQGSATQGYGNMALGQQQNVYGAIANQNNANVSAQNEANKANQGRGFMGVLGGLAQGATAAAKFLNEGGEVAGPKSAIGQHFKTMKEGGVIPGNAKVKGDSVENDTVPIMASPGEMVIPRTVMQQKDPAKAAAAFVAAHMAKKKHGSKKAKR